MRIMFVMLGEMLLKSAFMAGTSRGGGSAGLYCQGLGAIG
jgi:hypothetical protein